MEESNQTATLWKDLAVLVSNLPQEQRLFYKKALRSFAHDWRQTIGQVQSAVSLLKRQFITAPEINELEEWAELLGIIQAANRQASDLLDKFSNGLVEELE